MRIHLSAGLSVVLFVMVSGSSASSISILNASFENPSCGVSAPISCTPADWTVTVGTADAFLPAGTAWDSIPDGSQVAWSNGGTLTQILAATITPDTTYTLSVWVSQRWEAGSFLPEIQLLGGSTPLFIMNNSNPGGSAPTKNNDGTYNWVDWTMSWTSPSSGPAIGQTLGIVLGSDGIQTDFDDISLTASVPEPAAIVLVSAGLFALVTRRRLAK